MNLVLGVLFIYFGGVLVYVATHGIEGGATGFWAIWQQALKDVTGGQ